MNKLIFILISCLTLSLNLHAQKDKDKKTLTDDETLLDSTKLLAEIGHQICQCIDSLDKAETNKAKKKQGAYPTASTKKLAPINSASNS